MRHLAPEPGMLTARRPASSSLCLAGGTEDPEPELFQLQESKAETHTLSEKGMQGPARLGSLQMRLSSPTPLR